ERHCDKWNKYYRAKKRQGTEVPLGPGGARAAGRLGIDPADYREPADAEDRFVACCERLCSLLSEEEQKVLLLRLQDKTLEEIALKIGRSESTVSNRLSRIRTLLQEE